MEMGMQVGVEMGIEMERRMGVELVAERRGQKDWWQVRSGNMLMLPLGSTGPLGPAF